ncbi:MAG: hypothetical protein HOJ00_05990 [Phycisphaerae bacterium]|nr:hypothetical protein [Phycisphaerae bacterium]
MKLPLLIVCLTAFVNVSVATAYWAGNCCYQDMDKWQCNDAIEENECADLGGDWIPGGSCSTHDCSAVPNLNACCYIDADLGWMCIETTQYACINTYFGTFQAGLFCQDIDCEPAPKVGACCFFVDCTWTCQIMKESDCNQMYNSTYFSGIPCEDIDCPDPNDQYGACCYEDEFGVMTCVYTSLEKCDGHYFGTWHQSIECNCVDCAEEERCEIIASPDCVGPPQYPYPDYQLFGNGQIAVETASPSILGGAVITVFDLSGTPLPLNQDFPINRYNHPSWEQPNSDPAPDLGSIFGLAIDESGNLFVTATKTWATDIMGAGGWGAVYKINTNTAQISVFATIPMPNNESSLGTITYDCEHGQFFVSSFEDGIIYRIDYNTGAILGTYDHGVPYVGAPGPTPIGDRPWAVEVHGGRLYYAVWVSNPSDPTSPPNEIWSVKLSVTGAPVIGTDHLEITIPPLQGSKFASPVSDIDFSSDGNMFLAERTQINYTNLSAHSSRILEYNCVEGIWLLSANAYEVGIFNGTNASGGVDATLNNIWASGDALHFAQNDNIYGFQGFPIGGGDITTSALIDYQGNLTNTDKTLLGDLVCTDEDNPSGGDGVCCYQDNCTSYCAPMSAVACASYWGSTYIVNTTCATVSCPPAPQTEGACCFINEVGNAMCIETSTVQCNNLLGVYYGGIPCECIVCDPVTIIGACCYLDTSSGYMLCSEITINDCDALPVSTYNGDGSSCTNALCCEPIGACCISSNCLIISASQCSTSNGYYFGDGALCTNVDCASCPADLDGDGEINVADLLILIGAWGTCQ